MIFGTLHTHTHMTHVHMHTDQTMCNCRWTVFLTLGRRRVRSIKNRGKRVPTKTTQHYIRTNGDTNIHIGDFLTLLEFNDKCFPFRSFPL